MLNGEQLVDLKHKPLEGKEVTKIPAHQQLIVNTGKVDVLKGQCVVYKAI